MIKKEEYIYVGLDLHKEQHTAVIMDYMNKKLGEITFINKPSEFSKLVNKVKKYSNNKQAVYALENAYGYGRALAVWLIKKGYIVKDVNPALSYAYRKSVVQYIKNDSYDAECVEKVAINELDKLPDAIPAISSSFRILADQLHYISGSIILHQSILRVQWLKN